MSLPLDPKKELNSLTSHSNTGICVAKLMIVKEPGGQTGGRKPYVAASTESREFDTIVTGRRVLTPA